MNDLKPGTTWIHKKKGTKYTVVSLGKTLVGLFWEDSVNYIAEGDSLENLTIYTRPRANFKEKFEYAGE